MSSLPIIGQSTRAVIPAAERARLQRQAKLLAWTGNGWHLIEFAIAFAAGIAASSPALKGFAGDSLIEALAAFVIVWLFSSRARNLNASEQRAQKLIAATYTLLVAYILASSVSTLDQHQAPSTSWVGIGLAAFTAPTMPLLAAAKRRVGRQLNSSAVVSEAAQNQLCAYLSIALLVGLLANALVGWWWADPAAALVIAGIAAKEGLESWRGQSCECC